MKRVLSTVCLIGLFAAEAGAATVGVTAGSTGSVSTGAAGINTGINTTAGVNSAVGTSGTVGTVTPSVGTPVNGTVSDGTTVKNNGITTTRSAVDTMAGWSSERTYWQNQFSTRPYASGNSYTTYEPAYRYGVDLYSRSSGKRFEDLDQTQLRNQWQQTQGNSSLSWEQAQAATRDAYNRIYMNNNVNSSTAGSATIR